MLLADGSLQVCVVQGAAIVTVHSLPLPNLNAASERLAVHAWAHPVVPGGALLAVEASASGVTILEAAPRQACSCSLGEQNAAAPLVACKGPCVAR